MKIPAAIDRILELAESIEDYYTWASFRHAGTAHAPVPPREERMLEDHLQSLKIDVLYFVIVALEMGRGLLYPQGFMAAYLAVSEAFPVHFQAVARVTKDLMRLACDLDCGLRRLEQAGIDVNGLLVREA